MKLLRDVKIIQKWIHDRIDHPNTIIVEDIFKDLHNLSYIIDSIVMNLQTSSIETVNTRRKRAGLLNRLEISKKAKASLSFVDRYQPTEGMEGSTKLFYKADIVPQIKQAYINYCKSKEYGTADRKKDRIDAGFYSIEDLGLVFNHARSVVNHHIKKGHCQPPQHKYKYGNILLYNKETFDKAVAEYKNHMEKIHGDIWFSNVDVANHFKEYTSSIVHHHEVGRTPAPTHTVEGMHGKYYTNEEFKNVLSILDEFYKEKRNKENS